MHRDTTRLCREARGGDRKATEELFASVYEELRGLAGAYMGSPEGQTLQPTALVHEAYLRLIHQDAADWEDRRHFLAIAAHVMRCVLVDYTRKKCAAKRGGGWNRVPLEEVLPGTPFSGLDLLDLHDALEELAKLDARRVRIVDLRIFLGFNASETAECLGVSTRTVGKEWAGTRAWLKLRLES